MTKRRRFSSLIAIGALAISTSTILNATAASGATNSWFKPLTNLPLTVTNMIPGQSRVANFNIVNPENSPVKFALQVTNLKAHDNGCVRPETRDGDTTCGQNQGELQNFLLVTLTDITGTARQVFQGKLNQWTSQGKTDSVNIDSKKTRKYRIDYLLPFATGNIVQTDSVRFDLQFTLDQAKKDHGHGNGGHDNDDCSKNSKNKNSRDSHNNCDDDEDHDHKHSSH